MAEGDDKRTRRRKTRKRRVGWLGRKLCEAREGYWNHTQRECAKMLGVKDVNTIVRWETTEDGPEHRVYVANVMIYIALAFGARPTTDLLVVEDSGEAAQKRLKRKASD